MSKQPENLVNYVTGLADDSMVIGQRLSEWCSKAPFLEEDLALANVALDFLGRAQMFYNYATELHNEAAPEQAMKEDDLAFLRDAREYRNNLIHELPIGDFAFSLARQYLIDEFGIRYMQALTNSKDARLAAIAEKAIKESRYHLRRSQEWVIRLGDGTEESHQKVQQALNQLWGYTHELFEMTSAETDLIESGVAVDKSELQKAWLTSVQSTLSQATLQMPEDEWQITGGRDGVHTEHLGHMLAEMQYLQRTYPEQTW